MQVRYERAGWHPSPASIVFAFVGIVHAAASPVTPESLTPASLVPPESSGGITAQGGTGGQAHSPRKQIVASEVLLHGLMHPRSGGDPEHAVDELDDAQA
jgi:hypothetical protein